MHTIKFDMYQTLALAVAALLLGAWLRKKIAFLTRFCIPAPVVGGLVFAIVTCILHGLGIVDVTFDDTETVKSAWYSSLPPSVSRPI